MEFYNKIDLLIPITREDFETICADLFLLCLKPVEDVLEVCNLNITDLSYCPNLEILHAICDCGITNKSIQYLHKLRELNVSYNSKISDLTGCPNLQILDASGEHCGITSDNLKHVPNLIELNTHNNTNITPFSNCHNVRVNT